MISVENLVIVAGDMIWLTKFVNKLFWYEILLQI